MGFFIELVRWLGIAFVVYIFLRTLYHYPPTITIKKDIVQANASEPTDPEFMAEFEKAARLRDIGKQ